MSRKFLHFALLAALVAVSSLALADPPARVGRVTVTEGRVSMLVNGEEETGNLMNWPVTTDNHLTTAPGARAEFRVGSAAVRLDGDSDIEVEQLDDERMRLRLNYGTASVRVRDPAMLNDFELTTPQARIYLSEPGSVRVDTERAPDTTVVAVMAGTARVDAAGTTLTGRSGKRIEIRGDDIFTGLAQRDPFDDWVTTRDRREEGLVASRYIPSDMTGYEDLDQYGNWVDNSEYGYLWFPRAVPVGWAPYRDGRWVWMAAWGWTWVDNSPWGYAPFHYGRWVVVGNRWCWAPGRVVGRPVWSPALVGWVGGNNWSVTFTGGRAAPAVGWYPLTPRDRYVPAYHVSPDIERRLAWNHRSDPRWQERWQDRNHDGRRDGVTVLPRDHFDRNRNIVVGAAPRAVAPADLRHVPTISAPGPASGIVARPQTGQPWRGERNERDERIERANRERAVEQRPVERNIDRGQREERRVDLVAPRQEQDARLRGERGDRAERDALRDRNVITTAPQPTPQQGVLSTTPPAQFRPEERGNRQDPNPGRGRRDEDGRPDFSRRGQSIQTPQPQYAPPPQPAPVQMAPARPVQVAPPAPPPAQPQPPKQEPKQEQHRREKEERREERRDGEKFR